MKSTKQLGCITSALLLLGTIACQNHGKEPGKLEQAKDLINMGESVQKMAKQSQDLKEIEPVSEEELHNWFPENLLGLKRQQIAEGRLAGYGISGATAVYLGEGKKKLVVAVNDGAGENGTMLTSQYIVVKNLKPKAETGSKSERILDDGTLLGTETYYKAAKNMKIDFLYKDRFSVFIDGYDMTKQDTWKAFRELNIDKLF